MHRDRGATPKACTGTGVQRRRRAPGCTGTGVQRRRRAPEVHRHRGARRVHRPDDIKHAWSASSASKSIKICFPSPNSPPPQFFSTPAARYSAGYTIFIRYAYRYRRSVHAEGVHRVPGCTPKACTGGAPAPGCTPKACTGGAPEPGCTPKACTGGAPGPGCTSKACTGTGVHRREHRPDDIKHDWSASSASKSIKICFPPPNSPPPKFSLRLRRAIQQAILYSSGTCTGTGAQYTPKACTGTGVRRRRRAPEVHRYRPKACTRGAPGPGCTPKACTGTGVHAEGVHRRCTGTGVQHLCAAPRFRCMYRLHAGW